VIQGYSGVQHQRGLRDGYPSAAGFFFADTSVPMLLSYAVGAALFARERTGRGQYVEASLLGLGIAMQTLPWVHVEGEERLEADPLEDDVMDRVCPILQCSDGAYLCAGLVRDEEWQALCRATAQTALADDPRFATLEARNANALALREALAPVFAAQPRDVWLDALTAAGVPCTPLHNRDQALEEPQIVSNGLVAHLPHPTVGRTRVFNVPARLWDTPGAIRRPAPTFGQHTDSILQEYGYSADDIRALRERGAVQ
jgi:crotonobetainyl-CoA:carnitine CoA-transferase CaiB-like acyl-CoA transferase